eukprot:CAMPEP_0202706204 /NCGR_PEP_ID=MMETSP1385-20130828/18658_1 /ASSEMBLY_ACC=CAM_ASM_000861 /TAXON_ID=933848 /ORGANISM="Elphidium margaritaceum" /LENGTH=439 /DNA_ID=CAMNT_0049364621 /DNA_START=20 /DNA_END=1342 /DNA_ORIENTATION=-
MTEQSDLQNVPVEADPQPQEVIEVDHSAVTELKSDDIDTTNVSSSLGSKNIDNPGNNLIRPQRTASARTIRIASTEDRKGNIKKHTVYVIECDPSPPGVITVARRYNNFKWLRSFLCEQFPGLFVSPLPPANAMGRFDDSFVEERRQDLERFLNRLEAVKPFAESTAFKMFLSRPETTFVDGTKEVEEEYRNRGEEDKAHALSTLFPDLDEETLNESVHEDEIPKLVEFLGKVDQQMTVLDKSAERLLKHLTFVSKEMDSFSEAFDGLYTAETNYPYKATTERADVRPQFKLWSGYQVQQTDSYYENFFRSLRYEHQDIKALLELFAFHSALYKRYQRVCKAIERWNELDANNTELKPNQEKQKEFDFATRKQVLSLLNIATKIMMKNEIVLVWNSKTSYFRDKIQMFTKIQTDITNKMLASWKNVAVEHNENDSNKEN